MPTLAHTHSHMHTHFISHNTLTHFYTHTLIQTHTHARTKLKQSSWNTRQKAGSKHQSDRCSYCSLIFRPLSQPVLADFYFKTFPPLQRSLSQPWWWYANDHLDRLVISDKYPQLLPGQVLFLMQRLNEAMIYRCQPLPSCASGGQGHHCSIVACNLPSS